MSAWLRDHTCADRIQLYVPVASENVPGRFGHAGAKSAFPQSSRTAISTVEVRDIAAAKVPHQQPASHRIDRSKQKVHMIRHEAVRMNLALVLAGQVGQVRHVGEVVAIGAKTSATVVASLDDVQRDAGENQPRMPGHTARTMARGAG
jgi:hypothetical protein